MSIIKQLDEWIEKTKISEKLMEKTVALDNVRIEIKRGSGKERCFTFSVFRNYQKVLSSWIPFKPADEISAKNIINNILQEMKYKHEELEGAYLAASDVFYSEIKKDV
jgi:hypothetical protein